MDHFLPSHLTLTFDWTIVILTLLPGFMWLGKLPFAHYFNPIFYIQVDFIITEQLCTIVIFGTKFCVLVENGPP